MTKFLLLFSFLIPLHVYSQNEIELSSQFGILKSSETFDYSSYHKIKIEPDSEKIDLLNFETISETFPIPATPYNRDLHYGGWLRDDGPNSCLNTRGKVLVRDSVGSVTYTSNGCTVQNGKWDDPYTGRMHFRANDIQIDHLVALKNSYMTGGHEWDFKKRCLYANYMGNKFHLLSVNGPENLKKSDHTPDGYIPPNRRYVCSFVKNWLNVKLIWSLRITPPEAAAIQQIVRTAHCKRDMFVIPAAALAEQHTYIENNADLCASPGKQLVNF